MSNLRKYRESLNISQTTLAKAVGCTQGAIGHWESGRRFPDLKTCRALVACLNKLGAKVSLDCHERCNSDPHPTPEIRSRG
ncbi:helix-turn-helix transcriptional regulator [Escherichia coli]|uniref:helix-turn-helix transcriptional regulator n=1 Tax=Escherichia coli TaxID=562 RepID=UPI001919DFA2|nr:helix-turn-helix transcriptional regulator [Escherichia coli]